MLVWLSKMLLAHHFCTDSMLRLANGTAKPNLTHAVEWLDGFIGADGLPLIVSHLLQFQFLLVRLGKVNNY
jgi:hypothetical protein